MGLFNDLLTKANALLQYKVLSYEDPSDIY